MSASATDNACLTVRTLWSRERPESQIGYLSRSATAPTSRRPRCSSTRSRSLWGQSSRRPRLPTATRQTSSSPPSSWTSHDSTSSEWARQKALPVSVRSASSSPRRPVRSTVTSDGVVAHLAGADPCDAVEGHHPHLAIADLAGAGGLGDGRGHPLGLAVVGQHLDAHLGHEVHRV